ncbi:GPP34 family phosphoprotein [Streptomyces sp. HB132]|uniref:GOLPH3/VPS74 family protein n=1 Tax=Streptomyces sp. HB132 TaxID=767388 RepID=UPI001EF97B56|nr:GPP34 family phosphoprotein [Streptomyces sp. HB132]
MRTFNSLIGDRKSLLISANTQGSSDAHDSRSEAVHALLHRQEGEVPARQHSGARPAAAGRGDDRVGSRRSAGRDRGEGSAAPGGPPTDPFTASVWYDLPEDKPKGWLKFLHNKAHTAETPVRDQLVASGDVAIERVKKLGVVSTNRVTVVHPDLVHDLQVRVRAIVLDGAPADGLTDELAMAVLAVELELTSVWSKEDRRTHKSALKAQAARFDAFVPGLRKALRDSYLASRAVGGGWSA